MGPTTVDTNDKIILAAKYFVKKNEEDKKGLDPLKLQKLLYYTKAWSLVFNKKNIFPDEFQAWVHGPANPKVYHEFKSFSFADEHPEIVALNFKEIFTDEERDLLDSVWGIYGKYDGKYLEQLTHNEEPWQLARRELDPAMPSQNVISDDSIKSYYERRLKEASGSTAAN